MPEPTKTAPAPNKNCKNAVTKTQEKGYKQCKNSRKEGYCIHQYKVLKQIHYETGILTKAMGTMNAFVNDITGCITRKPCCLAH
ncbi:Histone H2B 5, partial [Gavia stellata]